MAITRYSDGITVNWHEGTWQVIDEGEYAGERVFLLEDEEYGPEVNNVIVNNHGDVIVEDFIGTLQEGLDLL